MHVRIAPLPSAYRPPAADARRCRRRHVAVIGRSADASRSLTLPIP